MKYFSILDYGAQEGILCTAAIQAAFDAADADCGTVVIPRGVFTTGSIDMKGASLLLEKGAVLRGSGDIRDYRDFGFVHNEMKQVLSLLYSQENDHIRISGEGTIDLGGSAFFDLNQREVPASFPELTAEQLAQCTAKIGVRPTQPIFFHRCRNVTLQDVTILDASNWTLSFNDCEDVRLTDLTIRTSPVIPNNDGMHFCGCRRVLVRGCTVVSGDDCIALSGITDWNIPCEDVTISDCVLTCSSKAIVLGYMHSVVRNVVISNCIIRDSHRGLCIMSSTKTGLVEHVLAENMRIETRVRAGNWWGNGEPLCFFALHHHNENYLHAIPDREWPVNIRDIHLRNISCTGENACAIVGDGGSVQQVTIDGLTYERMPAANVRLKGEGVIDVSPAQEQVTAPRDAWLLVQGCRDVTVRNASAADENGEPLKIHMA